MEFPLSHYPLIVKLHIERGKVLVPSLQLGPPNEARLLKLEENLATVQDVQNITPSRAVLWARIVLT